MYRKYWRTTWCTQKLWYMYQKIRFFWYVGMPCTNILCTSTVCTRNKQVREPTRTNSKIKPCTIPRTSYFWYISPETPKTTNFLVRQTDTYNKIGTPDGYVQKIGTPDGYVQQKIRTTLPTYKKSRVQLFWYIWWYIWHRVQEKYSVFGTCTNFLVHTGFAVHLPSKIFWDVAFRHCKMRYYLAVSKYDVNEKAFCDNKNHSKML